MGQACSRYVESVSFIAQLSKEKYCREMSSHDDNGKDDVGDQDDNDEDYIYNAIIVEVKIIGFEISVHSTLLEVALRRELLNEGGFS